MPRRTPISLTRLEGEVMRAVWDMAPSPVRVRDVAEALNAGRKDPLAYTTVQTMLTILKDKGIVESAPGPGRAHYFRARVSRDDASRHMLRDLADRLFAGRKGLLRPLLHHLIDEDQLDPAELAELRDFIDHKLRDAQPGEQPPRPGSKR